MSAPIIDISKEATWIFSPSKSQANNTGAFIADLTNFQGPIGVPINIGTKSTGDSDGAITIRLITSATNNISNGTNYTPPFGDATVATTNNATASGVLIIDPRSANRYAFWGVVVAGTNSPAYPVAVAAVGSKKVQPAS